MFMSLKNLLHFYQKPEMTNNEYLKFKASVELIHDFDACILEKFPCLIKKKLEKIYHKTIEAAIQDEINTCE